MQDLTYKGWTLYKAFGCRIAATKGDKVLGFFTSLDEAMRAIDKLSSAS